MRYVNPRGRSGGSQAAYFYGSSLQNTGAGPFTITAPSSPGPYPQWWRYVGTNAVVLTLPALGSFAPTRAYLFAVHNDGSCGASVQVEDAAASVIVTVAIGETVLIGWDSALLVYDVVGTWGAGGGGISGTTATAVFAMGAAAGVVQPAGFTVQSGGAGYTVTATDVFCYLTQNNAASQFLTLPNPTGAGAGRMLMIRSAAGSTGAFTVIVSGGSGITGSSGNLNAGQFRVWVSNGANWHELIAG